MNNLSPSRPAPGSSLIPIVVLLLLALEGSYISQGFDAYGLAMQADLEGWRRVFGQFGNLLKIGILTLVLFCLLVKDRLAGYWRSLVQLSSWRRVLIYGLPHLVAALALLGATGLIFNEPDKAAQLPWYFYLLWILSAVATLLSWTLMLAPAHFYKQLFSNEYRLLISALAIGCAVWLVAMYTRELWGPMSELTFVLSALLLGGLYGDRMAVYPEEKILGLGDFLVNIAPACSGYEGVGLVCAFTAVYIFVNRSKVRMPQILLLFPLGAVVVWLLNIVRIVVLIMLGHHWSPEVAVGGFHSHAGWITFIATSLIILWLAGNSAFFARIEPRDEQDEPVGLNLPVATLVPMVTLLALALLTSAFTADFDWLYPLRVIGVVIALVVVWRHLQLLPYKPRVEPVIAGLAVALLWALMLGRAPDADAAFQAGLQEVSAGWAATWLAFRFVGAAITVPIAEELVFRGYMLCRLSGVEVAVRGRLPWSLAAIALSSLAFGVLHGAWLAGTLAGLVYAVVRLRSEHIGDAIIAHAVTNAALFAYAGYTGIWSVL